MIVLGWEMNGTTYTHRCGPDPEAWKKYWNRIVTTMRAVPGQKFRFDFAPTRGRDAVPWTQCYPGDDTVDIIGMDSYDQPAGMTFDEQVEEPYGLQAHVDFAKAHGKARLLSRMGAVPQRRQSRVHAAHARLDGRAQAALQHADRLLPARCVAVRHNPGSASTGPSSPAATGAATPGAPVTPRPRPGATPAPPPPHRSRRAAGRGCRRWTWASRVEHWLGGKLCLRLRLVVAYPGSAAAGPAGSPSSPLSVGVGGEGRAGYGRRGVRTPPPGPPGPRQQRQPAEQPARARPHQAVTAGDAEVGSARLDRPGELQELDVGGVLGVFACRVSERETALAMSAARSGREEVAVIGDHRRVRRGRRPHALPAASVTGTPAHTCASPSTASCVATRPYACAKPSADAGSDFAVGTATT